MASGVAFCTVVALCRPGELPAGRTASAASAAATVSVCVRECSQANRVTGATATPAVLAARTDWTAP